MKKFSEIKKEYFCLDNKFPQTATSKLVRFFYLSHCPKEILMHYVEISFKINLLYLKGR
jgi:hypothetical protein